MQDTEYDELDTVYPYVDKDTVYHYTTYLPEFDIDSKEELE